ncbi:MAG TPA: HAD family phosphatase, partial [Trueperaceae bacterium]|nr:HAD family phosphatase [Trueperaceae bacterium]
MIPRPKLIAFDLDGTLLKTDKSVSDKTIFEISRLKDLGTKVVICTGRPKRTAEPVIKKLGLTEYAIMYNGAFLYSFKNEKEITCFGMNKLRVDQTISKVQEKFPEAMAAIETRDGWYTDPDYYKFRKLRSELSSEPTGVGNLADFITGDVIKLLFRHPHKKSSELATALTGLDVHGTWSFDSLLEVSGKNVTKANALRWLCNELNIAAKDVAAFGDQNNDKEMLAWAGFGVAVDNAVPEAKAVADFVTKSND